MATLTQTSCFSESLVAAPDEFYYHGGADYIGFGGKVFSGVSSARVIFDTQGDETKAKNWSI